MSINTSRDPAPRAEADFWKDHREFRHIRARSFEHRYRDLVTRRERILCAGDLGPESACSLINPGVIRSGDGYRLLLRGEPDDSTWLGQWKTTRAEPIWCELDASLALRDQFRLTLVDHPADWRAEDWRLFEFQGEVLSNHSVYMLDGDELVCRPAVSRVDTRERTLTLLQVFEPPFECRKEEKNWAFFEHRKELYCIYSFAPFVLFKVSLDAPVPEIARQSRGIPINGSFVGSSSNPVVLDTDRLIMFVHDYVDPDYPYQRNRLYRQYAATLRRSTLLPDRALTDPIVVGGDEQGRHPGVHYTSALVCEERQVRAFYGEGDTNTGVVTINRQMLEEVLDSGLSRHETD